MRCILRSQVDIRFNSGENLLLKLQGFCDDGIGTLKQGFRGGFVLEAGAVDANVKAGTAYSGNGGKSGYACV